MTKLRNVKVRREERRIRPAISQRIEADREAHEEVIHMMDDLGHLVWEHNSKSDPEEKRQSYQAIAEMVKKCRIQYCRAVDARAQAVQAGGAVVLKKFVECGLENQEFDMVKDVFSKEKERDPEKYIGRNGKLMLLSDTEEGEDSPAESPLPSQQPVENLEPETHRKVRFNLADNTYYVDEVRKSGSGEEDDGTAPASANGTLNHQDGEDVASDSTENHQGAEDLASNGTENHHDAKDLASNGTEYHQDGEGLASESAKTASVEGDKLKRSQASQSKKRRGRRRTNRNDSKKSSGRKGSNTDYSSSDSDDGCKRKLAEADNEARPPARKRRRRKLAVQGPQFPSDADLDSDMDAIIELDSDRAYCYCGQQSDGAMVGCDAEGCPNEWFHLRCARLKAVPTGLWFCRDCKKKYGEAIPLRQPEQLKVIKVEVVDGEEQMSFPQNQNADHNIGMGNNTLNTKETGREVAVQRKLRAYGNDSDPDVIVLDDERIYCICDRVSYDPMTRCHARGCKTEWYHIRCMGLKEIPEAPWFCPTCQGKFAGRAIPMLKRGPNPELLKVIKEEVPSDNETAGEGGQMSASGDGSEHTPQHHDAASDKGIKDLSINHKPTMKDEDTKKLVTNPFIRQWLIRGRVGIQLPLESIVQVEDGRLYCICGRVSQELMVACHGEECALVWFHLSCAGLKSIPEEEWLCPRCTAERGAGEEQEESRVRGIDTVANGRAPAAPVAYDPNKIIKQEMVSDDDV